MISTQALSNKTHCHGSAKTMENVTNLEMLYLVIKKDKFCRKTIGTVYITIKLLNVDSHEWSQPLTEIARNLFICSIII